MNQYDESYYSRGIQTGIVGRFVISLSRFMQTTRKAFRGTPGWVLEIGFGDGSFLEALARKGWDAYGIDISDEALEMARSKVGLSVMKGELLDCGMEESFFDVVVMRHVLEHITNPGETLVEIRRILKQNGTVYITVPNIDSIEACIAGDKWFHHDPEYHVTEYSPVTIRNALSMAGFKDARINHMLPEYRQTLTYSVLSRIGLDSVVSGRDVSLLKRLLVYILLPLGVIASYICSLVGRGGTIEVTARK